MKQFDIWEEGHKATGGGSRAQLLALAVEAETFVEAVKKWYNALAAVSDVESMYGLLEIKGNKAFLWGCELFDNPDDARKSFG